MRLLFKRGFYSNAAYNSENTVFEIFQRKTITKAGVDYVWQLEINNKYEFVSLTIFDFRYASPNSFVLRIPLVTFLRSIVADLLAFLLLLLFVASLVIYQYLDTAAAAAPSPLLVLTDHDD